MSNPAAGNGPPRAPRRPHVHVEHGLEREDAFYWLRDREDPELRPHLEAENAWTRGRLAHLAPLRSVLYAEMLGRIQEDDDSVAIPNGRFAWFRRTVAGSDYPIYLRRPVRGGPEEVVLDVNQLAQGRPYLSLATLASDPDQRRVAYTTDESGGEHFTLKIRDLDTGTDLQDVTTNTNGQAVWSADGRTVLYVELDAAHRAFRLRAHTLGTTGPDPVLFEEPDARFRVVIRASRSRRFIVVTVLNFETTEVRCIDAADVFAPMRVLAPRQKGVRTMMCHAAGRIYALTNHGGAPNRKLMEIPDGAAPITAWREIVAHRPDVDLVDVDGFAGHIVITERERGQLRIRVLAIDAAGEPTSDRIVRLPEPSVVGTEQSPEHAGGVVYASFTSMTTPPSLVRVDLTSLEITWLKEQPVPGYDRTRYQTTRLEAVAADGTRVPISVVARADLDLSAGPHPCVLYGYGSYGLTVDPEFSPSRVSLLDRGVVYCIAHVRGGGFLGRTWYEAGKFQFKNNTFTDFIACGRTLSASGITSPERLAISGGSAGGLLVGAVVNQAPDLCRAALAAVPFVDVLTSMLDASLPLTEGEYEEWGNPRDRAVYDTIRSYSPYDNVHAAEYPDLLVTGGLTDPRVPYWEPTKWVQRLRERAASVDVLLWMQLGAGHGGPSGRYGALEERAFEFAFLLDRLGATEPLAPPP